MPIKGLFCDHPTSLGETYSEHMKTALGFSGPLLRAGLAAAVHAVFPFLYVTTASGTVRRLNDRMTRRCAACPSGQIHRPDLFAPPLREPEFSI